MDPATFMAARARLAYYECLRASAPKRGPGIRVRLARVAQKALRVIRRRQIVEASDTAEVVE